MEGKEKCGGGMGKCVGVWGRCGKVYEVSVEIVGKWRKVCWDEGRRDEVCGGV